MPRRCVMNADWMRIARANGWSINYERRHAARSLGADRGAHVLRVLSSFPDTEMGLTGWLDKEASGLLMSARVRSACESAQIPLWNYEMLARWYWGDSEWQEYVRQFNSLPDPSGFYCFSFGEGRITSKVVHMGGVDNLGVNGNKRHVVHRLGAVAVGTG